MPKAAAKSEPNVTLKQVAHSAGVSLATASYVLNDTKPTTPEVAQRVRLAAKTLGYRPNQAARALKTGSTRAIGFVVPDLQNPFFPKIVQAAEHRARELGYSLMLVDINDDPRVERDALEQFARAGVEAVICGSLKGKLPAGLPYPVIALDSPMPGSDGVYADHFHGGMLAMQFALEHGHDRIGLLSGPQITASAKLRRDGAVSAVGHAQIVWEYECPFSLEVPEKAIQRLLRREVSLVIAGSDVIAIGAMNALLEHGFGVPDDVSLIGFDDIAWSSIVRPRLTTVQQPIEEIGTHAVDAAVRRIKTPSAAVSSEVLGVRVIERDSVLTKQSTPSTMA
jgi:LacI family transcriptional regulator